MEAYEGPFKHTKKPKKTKKMTALHKNGQQGYTSKVQFIDL